MKIEEEVLALMAEEDRIEEREGTWCPAHPKRDMGISYNDIPDPDEPEEVVTQETLDERLKELAKIVAERPEFAADLDQEEMDILVNVVLSK